jgi:preprotein translocase subunit YajC
MTLVELVPFAAVAAAFWLLIIRPASTRRKAQAALVASLAPGQRVMTTAGVFGTVTGVDGERVSVEIAPGVVVEMLALAIAQVVPAVADAPESPPPTEPDPGGPSRASEDGDRSATGPTLEADRG